VRVGGGFLKCRPLLTPKGYRPAPSPEGIVFRSATFIVKDQYFPGETSPASAIETEAWIVMGDGFWGFYRFSASPGRIGNRKVTTGGSLARRGPVASCEAPTTEWRRELLGTAPSPIPLPRFVVGWR